jgi:Ca2+-binding EF-hand superfamily protein
MNKPHLYTTLFLALSSAYLSACSTVASDMPRLNEAQQKQLASERAGHLRQTHVRFNALDKDEDGYISRAEFNRSGDLAFERMDTNKDGMLSAADPKPEPRGEDTRSEQTRSEQTRSEQTRSEQTRQQQAQRTEQPRRERLLKMPTTHSVDGMLAMYDSNKDGVISREEYAKGRAAQFAATDANGDGQLSYDEYVTEFAGRLDQQISQTGKKAD